MKRKNYLGLLFLLLTLSLTMQAGETYNVKSMEPKEMVEKWILLLFRKLSMLVIKRVGEP